MAIKIDAEISMILEFSNTPKPKTSKATPDPIIETPFKALAFLRAFGKQQKYPNGVFNMVRETGLEPARPKAYAPKAYVYTNFTTRAKFKWRVAITLVILAKNAQNSNDY